MNQQPQQPPEHPLLTLHIWQDPPPHRRALKMAVAMALTLFASSLLSGGLTPDTTLAMLINLMLALSLPGMEAAGASAQLLILFVGVSLMLASFATFAAYSRSLSIAVLGAVGVGIATTAYADAFSGITTAVLLLLPTLLLCPLHRRRTYKELLTLVTLVFLLLMTGTLVWSVITAVGRLTPDALRESMVTVGVHYADFYEQLAGYIRASGVDAVGMVPLLPQEGAVSAVINYLPALLPGAAMLCAFWFVTWFYRADGRQPPRIALVIRDFTMSKVGALAFLLCAGLSFVRDEVLSLAATEMVILLSFPFCIHGVDATRRHMLFFGRTMPLLIFLVLLLFAPPTGMMLFFAVCGVIDALIPTAPPWRTPRP